MNVALNIIKGLIVALADILPLSADGFKRIFGEASTYVHGTDKFMWFLFFSEIGVVAALLLKFRNEISDCFKALISAGQKISRKEQPFREGKEKEILAYVRSSLPILLWYFIRISFWAIYRKPLTVVAAFTVSGIMLVIADKVEKGELSLAEMKPSDGFLGGIFRALGFIPGISGTGGMLLMSSLIGLSADSTCKYIFMLSIPIYIGKIFSGIGGLFSVSLNIVDAAGCVLSFVFALVSAYFMCDLLKRMYVKKNLRIFSVILFILAAFMLILWMRG